MSNNFKTLHLWSMTLVAQISQSTFHWCICWLSLSKQCDLWSMNLAAKISQFTCQFPLAFSCWFFLRVVCALFFSQVHDILQGRHCACLEAATWRPLSSLFSFNSSNQHYVSKYSTSTRASSPIASVLSWARGRGPKGYYYASGRNPCVRRIA